VLIFEADGGLWMNIHELATLSAANLQNTALFILNNGGYGSIRLSQETHLKYKAGCDESSNLNFPIWSQVANLFGFKYEKIDSLERFRDLCKVMEKPFEFTIYDLVVPDTENRGPRLKTIVENGLISTQPLAQLQW
jgi:acetolactate synthase-1/2/3 large subunit